MRHKKPSICHNSDWMLSCPCWHTTFCMVKCIVIAQSKTTAIFEHVKKINEERTACIMWVRD